MGVGVGVGVCVCVCVCGGGGGGGGGGIRHCGICCVMMPAIKRYRRTFLERSFPTPSYQVSPHCV